PWTRPLVRAFSEPEPQLAAGALLGRNRWATSLTDASDGLEASVRLLADASRTGAAIDLSAVSVASPLRRWAEIRKQDPLNYVLRGGEDYALVFTARPSVWRSIQRRLPQAAVIGRILSRRDGCWAETDGKKVSLSGYGFAHFKND